MENGYGNANNSENIINIEYLNKTFISLWGFWKWEKHSVQAVKDISGYTSFAVQTEIAQVSSLL